MWRPIKARTEGNYDSLGIVDNTQRVFRDIDLVRRQKTTKHNLKKDEISFPPDLSSFIILYITDTTISWYQALLDHTRSIRGWVELPTSEIADFDGHVVVAQVQVIFLLRN